jgi:hypothetical protein
MGGCWCVTGRRISKLLVYAVGWHVCRVACIWTGGAGKPASM